MKKTRYFLLILTLIFGMTSCARQQSSKSIDEELQSIKGNKKGEENYFETYESVERSLNESPQKVDYEKKESLKDDGYMNGNVLEIDTEKVAKEDVKKALLQWNPKGSNNYYLMPKSKEDLLTEKELKCFNKTELRLIRNEIAARYGWEFEDPELKSYFITQEWYEPKEGQNDLIQFTNTEIENISLIEALENKEEQPENYHRLEELTELKPGNLYEFCFGKTRITLETSDDNDHKVMTLLENGEEIMSHEYYDENDRVLVYNRKNESYLLVSRGFCDNDYVWSPLYLLNNDGVTFLQWVGGVICAYTGNAICKYDEGIAIGHYFAYEWLFIQENDLIPMGKAITEKYSYKVKKEFAGYSVDNDNLSNIIILPGETMILERIDNRNIDVCWIELKKNGQLVLLPYFRDDEGFLDKCEDGSKPWEYFDVLEPAG